MTELVLFALLGMLTLVAVTVVVTCVCGVTVSAFARCWGGNGFKSRAKLRHS